MEKRSFHYHLIQIIKILGVREYVPHSDSAWNSVMQLKILN